MATINIPVINQPANTNMTVATNVAGNVTPQGAFGNTYGMENYSFYNEAGKEVPFSELSDREQQRIILRERMRRGEGEYTSGVSGAFEQGLQRVGAAWNEASADIGEALGAEDWAKSERADAAAIRQEQLETPHLAPAGFAGQVAEGIAGSVPEIGIMLGGAAAAPFTGGASVPAALAATGVINYGDALSTQQSMGMDRDRGEAAQLAFMQLGIDALGMGVGGMTAKAALKTGGKMTGWNIAKKQMTQLGGNAVADAVTSGLSQVNYNAAFNRPLTEGLAESVALGTAAGGVFNVATTPFDVKNIAKSGNIINELSNNPDVKAKVDSVIAEENARRAEAGMPPKSYNEADRRAIIMNTPEYKEAMASKVKQKDESVDTRAGIGKAVLGGEAKGWDELNKNLSDLATRKADMEAKDSELQESISKLESITDPDERAAAQDIIDQKKAELNKKVAITEEGDINFGTMSSASNLKKASQWGLVTGQEQLRKIGASTKRGEMLEGATDVLRDNILSGTAEKLTKGKAGLAKEATTNNYGILKTKLAQALGLESVSAQQDIFIDNLLRKGSISKDFDAEIDNYIRGEDGSYDKNKINNILEVLEVANETKESWKDHGKLPRKVLNEWMSSGRGLFKAGAAAMMPTTATLATAGASIVGGRLQRANKAKLEGLDTSVIDEVMASRRDTGADNYIQGRIDKESSASYKRLMDETFDPLLLKAKEAERATRLKEKGAEDLRKEVVTEINEILTEEYADGKDYFQFHVDSAKAAGNDSLAKKIFNKRAALEAQRRRLSQKYSADKAQPVDVDDPREFNDTYMERARLKVRNVESSSRETEATDAEVEDALKAVRIAKESMDGIYEIAIGEEKDSVANTWLRYRDQLAEMERKLLLGKGKVSSASIREPLDKIKNKIEGPYGLTARLDENPKGAERNQLKKDILAAEKEINDIIAKVDPENYLLDEEGNRVMDSTGEPYNVGITLSNSLGNTQKVIRNLLNKVGEKPTQQRTVKPKPSSKEAKVDTTASSTGSVNDAANPQFGNKFVDSNGEEHTVVGVNKTHVEIEDADGEVSKLTRKKFEKDFSTKQEEVVVEEAVSTRAKAKPSAEVKEEVETTPETITLKDVTPEAPKQKVTDIAAQTARMREEAKANQAKVDTEEGDVETYTRPVMDTFLASPTDKAAVREKAARMTSLKKAYEGIPEGLEPTVYEDFHARIMAKAKQKSVSPSEVTVLINQMKRAAEAAPKVEEKATYTDIGAGISGFGKKEGGLGEEAKETIREATSKTAFVGPLSKAQSKEMDKKTLREKQLEEETITPESNEEAVNMYLDSVVDRAINTLSDQLGLKTETQTGLVFDAPMYDKDGREISNREEFMRKNPTVKGTIGALENTVKRVQKAIANGDAETLNSMAARIKKADETFGTNILNAVNLYNLELDTPMKLNDTFNNADLAIDTGILGSKSTGERELMTKDILNQKFAGQPVRYTSRGQRKQALLEDMQRRNPKAEMGDLDKYTPAEIDTLFNAMYEDQATQVLREYGYSEDDIMSMRKYDKDTHSYAGYDNKKLDAAWSRIADQLSLSTEARDSQDTTLSDYFEDVDSLSEAQRAAAMNSIEMGEVPQFADKTPEGDIGKGFDNWKNIKDEDEHAFKAHSIGNPFDAESESYSRGLSEVYRSGLKASETDDVVGLINAIEELIYAEESTGVLTTPFASPEGVPSPSFKGPEQLAEIQSMKEALVGKLKGNHAPYFGGRFLEGEMVSGSILEDIVDPKLQQILKDGTWKKNKSLFNKEQRNALEQMENRRLSIALDSLKASIAGRSNNSRVVVDKALSAKSSIPKEIKAKFKKSLDKKKNEVNNAYLRAIAGGEESYKVLNEETGKWETKTDSYEGLDQYVADLKSKVEEAKRAGAASAKKLEATYKKFNFLLNKITSVEGIEPALANRMRQSIGQLIVDLDSKVKTKTSRKQAVVLRNIMTYLDQDASLTDKYNAIEAGIKDGKIDMAALREPRPSYTPVYLPRSKELTPLYDGFNFVTGEITPLSSQDSFSKVNVESAKDIDTLAKYVESLFPVSDKGEVVKRFKEDSMGIDLGDSSIVQAYKSNLLKFRKAVKDAVKEIDEKGRMSDGTERVLRAMQNMEDKNGNVILRGTDMLGWLNQYKNRDNADTTRRQAMSKAARQDILDLQDRLKSLGKGKFTAEQVAVFNSETGLNFSAADINKLVSLNNDHLKKSNIKSEKEVAIRKAQADNILNAFYRIINKNGDQYRFQGSYDPRGKVVEGKTSERVATKLTASTKGMLANAATTAFAPEGSRKSKEGLYAGESLKTTREKVGRAGEGFRNVPLSSAKSYPGTYATKGGKNIDPETGEVLTGPRRGTIEKWIADNGGVEYAVANTVREIMDDTELSVAQREKSRDEYLDRYLTGKQSDLTESQMNSLREQIEGLQLSTGKTKNIKSLSESEIADLQKMVAGDDSKLGSDAFGKTGRPKAYGLGSLYGSKEAPVYQQLVKENESAQSLDQVAKLVTKRMLRQRNTANSFLGAGEGEPLVSAFGIIAPKGAAVSRTDIGAAAETEMTAKDIVAMMRPAEKRNMNAPLNDGKFEDRIVDALVAAMYPNQTATKSIRDKAKSSLKGKDRISLVAKLSDKAQKEYSTAKDKFISARDNSIADAEKAIKVYEESSAVQNKKSKIDRNKLVEKKRSEYFIDTNVVDSEGKKVSLLRDDKLNAEAKSAKKEMNKAANNMNILNEIVVDVIDSDLENQIRSVMAGQGVGSRSQDKEKAPKITVSAGALGKRESYRSKVGPMDEASERSRYKTSIREEERANREPAQVSPKGFTPLKSSTEIMSRIADKQSKAKKEGKSRFTGGTADQMVGLDVFYPGALSGK